MYSATFIFLTILGRSLAYLPDPDNCCESVEMKKYSDSYLDGVFKLDTLKEYLVNEQFVNDAKISYNERTEEWLIRWGQWLEYSSNSTETCPENVEAWDNRGILGDYLGVSEMKVVCYKPFYKKYWYVILIACLLVVVLCCRSCCGRLSKKNEKSENAVMEVHIMTVSTVLERT